MITIKTTVDELRHDELISVRTYNACVYNNPKLLTVGDIAKFYNERKTFLHIRNCGKKSTSELMNILSNLNGSIEITEQFDDARDDVQQVFIDEYELFTSNPNKEISLIDAFQVIFPSSKDFYEICINKPADIFGSKNYSLITNGSLAYKVRCAAVEIISEISRRLLNQLAEDDSFRASISKLCANTKEALYNDYNADYCKYELSSVKRELLLREFNELIEKASARAKSMSIALIPNIYSLIPLLNLTKEQFGIRFGNKKKSSSDFYIQVLLPFRDTYNTIIQGEIDDSYLDMAVKFPFLDKTSTDFVLHFKETEGYYPMFFITNELLRNSQRRDYKMYCQKYALGNYAEKSTLIEIANANSLTRERVRQIIGATKLQDERIFNYNDWNHYADTHDIFITDQSEYFIELLVKEHLNISFEGFAQIYSIVFKYIYNCDYGFEYLVSGKYAQEVANLISKTTSLKNGNLSSNKKIPLSELCNIECIDTKLYNAIKSEIAPLLDVEMEDSSFLFAQTYVDYAREVYDYLYSVGEPVHIDTIVEYLNHKFPSHPITINNLKVKLRATKRILPVGKTSNYKLSHWRNVFGGSIRDLIRDIMQSRENPIHIDELTNLVTDSFEKTNQKSILSSLYSCDDFVSFAGGYYGLFNKEYPSEYVEIDVRKTRLSFEDRFENYKQFVEDCGRLPYLSGIEEEDSLKRWQSNVCKRILDVTDEQVKLLTDFMESKSNLPSSGSEDKFYRNCKEYLDFVKNNFELPAYATSNSLYQWFNKNIALYCEYEDNRKVYFTYLLQELKGYGFIF
jgi:hypothetical protein